MKITSRWARLWCTATLLNLAGCAGIAPEAPLRSGSHAMIEHQVVELTPSITVRYDAFSDSRCPKGAMCIWAGKVSYAFTLTSGAGSEHFALDYEGDRFDSKLLPGVHFGISFAGVRDRPIEQHAVVLEVTAP
jgi:hypothetical protein